MHLMKWLRKNNKKLMAIVVVVLMIAFIGGSAFSSLFQGSRGVKAALAYYGHKQKITYLDRMNADQEIEMLASLGADSILRAQDMRGILLGELVFTQNRSAAILDIARQTIQRNRYRITDEQLGQMYRDRTVPGDIYWILLCDEAQSAGIHIPNAEVGQLLGQIIPQLFDKRPYAQVMQSVMNRFNVPEEKILTTFGKLLGVLQYAQVISSLENVTTSQIRHLASGESESLSAEFVQLKAAYFADKGQEPPEDEVMAHFTEYRNNFLGDVNEANPFGFGYRQPGRVQFDYVALKLADVAAVAKPPTDEEAEQHYQQNREQQFTEQVPADPNDPNSPQVPRVQSYAEVVDTIMDQLRRQKILTKAEQILQEARNLADADLQMPGPDGKEPTTQLRKARTRDYAKIAEDLGKRHNLPLYSGRSGLLTATNMQGDQYLRRMALTGYGYSPISLVQLLFSVQELGDNATILLSVPQAEMYVTIGPIRDPMAATAMDSSAQIMMIARVVEVQKSSPPAGLDVIYSTKTIGLGSTDQNDSTFSVREEVTNDVRNLAAWDTTKNRAQEFMALANKEGWDRAIAQFNQLYGAPAKADPNDPNVFKLDREAGMRRISSADLQVLAAQVANSPAAPIILNQAKSERQLVHQLYSLIPAQSDAPPQMPVILEFKPGQSFYVCKSLSAQRLTVDEFQRVKGMIVRREEYSQVENLAAVHFNPENILKRMNFQFVNTGDEDKDATAEAPEKQGKEAS
jgi:hypothetical protein